MNVAHCRTPRPRKWIRDLELNNGDRLTAGGLFRHVLLHIRGGLVGPVELSCGGRFRYESNFKDGNATIRFLVESNIEDSFQ